MNLEQAIATTLVYFDIFGYPLTINEIARWLPSSISFTKNHLLGSIKELAEKGFLLKERVFIFCQGGEK